jgi:hypothetical protein
VSTASSQVIRPWKRRDATATLTKWQAGVVALSALLGLLFVGNIMRHSPGVATDDEIGHFVICRDAWHYPSLIVNIWGRMLYTLLYMVPARLGWEGARFFSLLLAAATVLLTTTLARKLGLRYFWLLPLLLWFQPFFATWSFNAITEVPFSALFVAAALLFVSGRYSAAALCVGLLPLIRYEGAVLLGVVAALCLLQRQWRPIVLSVLPLFFQNAITFLVLGELPFQMFLHPAHGWATGHATQIGAAASPFGFSYRFHMLPELAGVPVIILVITGFPHLFRRKDQAVVFTSYLLYFFVHVIITWLALYGELAGDRRYMLPLAPALALAAAIGLDAVVRAFAATARNFAGRPAMVATRALLVTGCIFVLGLTGWRNVAPLPESAEQIAVRQAANWVRAQHLASAPIVTANVWFDFLLPYSVRSQDLWVQTKNPNLLPLGTVAVWDSKYANSYGLPLSALQNGTWRELYAVRQPLPENPHAHFDVAIFEKVPNGFEQTKQRHSNNIPPRPHSS